MTPSKLSRAVRAHVAGVALILGATLGAFAQAPDPVVAKVNGIDIRQSDLALAEEDIGASLPQGITGEAKREYLTTYLADMILLSRAAEEQGMSGSDDFKRRFAMMRNKVLMDLLIRDVARKAVNDDAALRKVYEEAVKSMANEQEVRARHILVEKEEDAKAIAAELKNGADFAEVAKKKSTEPAAAESGGDLGYFSKDQMVPDFADAAFKLDKGKISDPIKTQFGWHIIKLEDKRTKTPPTFDQVKDQLETFVIRKAQTDLVTKLRAGAKIERMGAPAAAPAAAAPAPTAAPAAPGAATKK